MREREIEQYFIRRVREAGGLQRKFVSPGHKGVPDRICVLEGRVHFVELKAPGKALRSEQAREHARFRAHGGEVWTIDSKERVDYFIQQLCERFA
jgi:hypothetical protein